MSSPMEDLGVAIQRLAHRSEAVVVESVHEGGSAGFGQTVSLQDQQARGVEELGHVPGQRCTAGDEEI